MTAIQVTGDGQSLSATGTSSRVALNARTDSPDDSRFYAIDTNTAAAGAFAYIKFGDSTVEASATDSLPVKGGANPVIIRASVGDTHLAAVSSAGAVQVKIIPIITVR
ncbi:MAG: hypothetical protein MI745_14090 [Pseudomonadales bacterium]|nr:hypothetical protein [Pseudomonadales bacterium]